MSPGFGDIRFALHELPLGFSLEAEQVHQIADGWVVQRNVRVGRAGNWVGEIIPAARRERSQPPVRFDELQD